MSLENKTILLTGGTGSFGQAFTKKVLDEHHPKAIRIFSRTELLQFEMQQKFADDNRIRFFIGDVRDKERVSRAMDGVDIVVHAAALKQVPICEYNPMEAVKTNIDGTVSIIDAAINSGVEKAIAISTDKAVQPVNLYGATKMVMEKLFVQANVYASGGKTRFSCVRYGNVIGSRGSVIPIFIEQSKHGCITITDERMTRFWITLNQGVAFVLNCINKMFGGEIFIPKLPSMRIADLIETIKPGIKRKIIGIRPGEKLDEVLITQEESKHGVQLEKYYVITPEFSFWNSNQQEGEIPLADDFTYNSGQNDWWLSQEEIKDMINDF